MKKSEKRCFKCEEIRTDDEGKTLQGYAALFNTRTDMGEFIEEIAPSAFKKTIQEANIRCLWNHNADIILGSTKAGTLSLTEDDKGLNIKCFPSQTSQVAKDCMDAVRRQDVDGMSFGFYPVKDKWTKTKEGKNLRTLTEVNLFEVSPCVFPQYTETSITLRSVLTEEEVRDLDQNRIIDKKDKETSEVEENKEPLHAEHSESSETEEPIKPEQLSHSPLSLQLRKIKLMEIE